MPEDDRKPQRRESKEDGPVGTTTISITEEQIAKVDAKYPSPEQRAKEVWDRIWDRTHKMPGQWDLVCFCTHTLGLLSQEWPWLTSTAQALNKLVYIAHYTNADRLFGDKQ